MRKLLHILLFVSLPFIAISQNLKVDDIKNKGKSRLIGQVTIGSSSFNSSAILTIESSSKGLLIPRMTTAQRDAIGSPSTGLLIFNTITNQFEFFETTWQAIVGGGDMIGANNLSDVSNAATSYNNIKQQGTTTFIGAWESGTVAEINTGTDVTKLVTVDGLAGSQLQTDVTTNNAKVTNATHTGDVTGATVLAIDKTAISGKSSVTAASTDEILIGDASDGGNLKKVTAQSIADLGGAGVSFGSDEQIPFTNAGGTDFDYTSTFVFDDVNGRLGVGIDNPLSAFHVKGVNAVLTIEVSTGGNTGKLSFKNPTAEFGFIRAIDANGQIQFGGAIAGYFPVFYAAGSEVARITTVGNMGIAVTPPSTVRLNVRGVNAASTSDALLLEDNAGTDLMRVKNNGDVTTYQTLNFHSDTSVTNDTYGIVDTDFSVYTMGMNLYVDIAVANTGAATIQINALSAITIKKLHDQDLVTGDIEAGQIIHVIYDGVNFQMLSQLSQ